MHLSHLALAIYELLRMRVPDSQAQITYQDLALELGPMSSPNESLHWRDARLDAALGELVIACRKRQPPLPAISSLVIRAVERNPGPGYYPIAHPAEFQQGGELQALIAWGHEVQRARQTEYPAQL
jgi:hypothetical protein